MKEGHPGLEQNDGELIMTEFLFLGKQFLLFFVMD